MGNKKIIVAGHLCLDITPKFQNKAADRMEEVLAPGRVVNVGDASVHLGGVVANTGLALKKMGAKVSLQGKIGTDDFGRIVSAQLAYYGADENLIVSDSTQTSYSIVVAPKGVDRCFLHHPGANDSFCPADIKAEALADAVWFHFGYPPLMRRMYLEDGKELVEIFSQVRDLGITTSLDLAGVDEESEAGTVDWETVLKNVLPFVDFFVPSVEELAFMIDRSLYETWKVRAAGKDMTSVIELEEVRTLAEKCLAMGAGVVMIKCGTPGMYLAAGSTEKLETIKTEFAFDRQNWADVRHFEKSYKPEKILSGTGAGDTCIAAFIYAVTLGYSWQECLQFAAAQGASCVEDYDALGGLHSLDELKARIDAGWEKNE